MVYRHFTPCPLLTVHMNEHAMDTVQHFPIQHMFPFFFISSSEIRYKKTLHVLVTSCHDHKKYYTFWDECLWHTFQGHRSPLPAFSVCVISSDRLKLGSSNWYKYAVWWLWPRTLMSLLWLNLNVSFKVTKYWYLNAAFYESCMMQHLQCWFFSSSYTCKCTCTCRSMYV